MLFKSLTFVFGVTIISMSSAFPAPEAKEVIHENGLKGSSDTSKSQDKFSIANWESPEEVAELFPYYLTGYDEEDRPIGVIDLGKWDARSWAKRGKEAWDDLERHAEKMLYILKSGVHAKNMTDENGVTKPVTEELGLIVDFDGFSVAQATNPKVMMFLTKFLGKLQLIQHKLSYGYFINVNAVASALVRLLRPALGSAFERIEVFGTKSSDWLPVLRRNLPIEALPQKYGGKAGHKPIIFYG